MSDDRARRLAQLKQAYESGILDEDTYGTLVAALELQVNVEASLEGGGAIAQRDSVAAGQQGIAVRGNIDGPVIAGDDATVVFAEQGATVVIGEAPVKMTAVDRKSALGRYLQHIISRNRYLQLQGIRSGGRLVHIELDQIYVTLRATRQRVLTAEEEWLERERELAPGESQRLDAARRLSKGSLPAGGRALTETVTVSVNEALEAHRRLAVLGNPGCGKTTLLRYLALLYARDLAEGSTLVLEKLGLEESGCLPILLPLRQIGAYLRTHRPADDGTEGCGQLLEFLLQSLKNERIALPVGFFDEWLAAGRAVILLDGLDEVADSELRHRVSRLVEAFSRAYPNCRYAVTSRIVGYAGAARLGEGYTTTTVRDFSLDDVRRFLASWHRLVAVGQMGPGDSSDAYAAGQTDQLLAAIEVNERIRELAINPLMLTVIAMVHRDRVKLPDRRAELYAEAVDVLLGKWEEAKGLQEIPILEDQPFDTGDRRLVLQAVALRMHEAEQKEVAGGDLRRWLGEMFHAILGDWRAAERAIDRFLRVIQERTGLLVARGEGVYAFSHLTFQEYLASLGVAARDDYVEYTLARAVDPWWREVILLEAGYLSLQSKERTTRLIREIANTEEEPEPYYNLVLAAHCLRDVGANRVEGNLEEDVRRRIQTELETPVPRGRWASLRVRLSRGMSAEALARRRIAAAQALARIGGDTYWTLPHGEPDWVEIPAGRFWMGSETGYSHEKPVHPLHLERFWIARVPITNAQYRFFVQATGHEPPRHWEEDRPPRGLEGHPVVTVSWHDALAYCRWLGGVTGKAIALPSEAQWEKAARGDTDQREYPWGDEFEATRCNCFELGLGDTTPVGIFPEGASPYGVLDLIGNVWEWTRSLWGQDSSRPEFRYPYDQSDGRENLDADDEILRVLRGGAFDYNRRVVRCAYRDWYYPNSWYGVYGFRVVVAPVPSDR